MDHDYGEGGCEFEDEAEREPIDIRGKEKNRERYRGWKGVFDQKVCNLALRSKIGELPASRRSRQNMRFRRGQGQGRKNKLQTAWIFEKRKQIQGLRSTL